MINPYSYQGQRLIARSALKHLQEFHPTQFQSLRTDNRLEQHILTVVDEVIKMLDRLTEQGLPIGEAYLEAMNQHVFLPPEPGHESVSERREKAMPPNEAYLASLEIALLKRQQQQTL